MRITLLKAALLLLPLAACSGGDREPERTSAVEPEAPVTSAAEPAVPQEPAAQTATDALTADGWENLRIGMTREEIAALYGPDANPSAAGGADPAQCEQYRPENAPEGMLLMLVDGRLARISLIRESAIETAAGVGVGAEAAAVKSAYGAKAQASPHKYEGAPAEYVTIWETDRSGEAYVTDDAARGVRYVIGGDGRVQSIHVGGPAIQYVEGCS